MKRAQRSVDRRAAHPRRISYIHIPVVLCHISALRFDLLAPAQGMQNLTWSRSLQRYVGYDGQLYYQGGAMRV